jgi:hypothetical protein
MERQSFRYTSNLQRKAPSMLYYRPSLTLKASQYLRYPLRPNASSRETVTPPSTTPALFVLESTQVPAQVVSIFHWRYYRRVLLFLYLPVRTPMHSATGLVGSFSSSEMLKCPRIDICGRCIWTPNKLAAIPIAVVPRCYRRFKSTWRLASAVTSQYCGFVVSIFSSLSRIND